MVGGWVGWMRVAATNLEGEVLDPRYYANRAGKIAAVQVPIVVALGMKNNLVSCTWSLTFPHVMRGADVVGYI